MGRVPKEPYGSPGKVVPLPSAATPPQGTAADDEPDSVAADSSAPEVLDLRAQERDSAALDRDRATAEYLKRTYRDELTGALQREAGRDQLAHEVDRAHRFGDELVIAFIDVVHLKRVNDEQAHAAGDNVLRAVGEALRTGLRSYDLVVRYGGDEFVCALPRASLASAGQRFTDVNRLLGAAIPGASVSIGLAELTIDETLDRVANPSGPRTLRRAETGTVCPR